MTITFLSLLLVFGEAPAPTVAPALAELMRAARTHEAELLASEADLAQRRAALEVEDGGLWPRFDARLGYTRNQRETRFLLPDGAGTREIVITPTDQVEATFTLTVPLLDLGRRARIDASEQRIAGQAAQVADRAARTDESVANAYYEGVFANARVAIATSEIAASNERLARVRTRVDAGFAGPLELARAEAEVARGDRALADARMDEDAARRRIALLTGVGLTGGDVVDFSAGWQAAQGDADESGTLEAWLAQVDTLPAVAALEREAAALRTEARAAGLDLVPTVDAFVSERLTNASGFGEPDNLQAGVTATFRLDLPALARDDEVLARARAADLRVEAARRAARARIEDLWSQIGNRKARIAAGLAEVAAQEAALREIGTKQSEGTSTAVELQLAQRDLSDARVEVARSRAELALARVLLAIAGGRP